jgi:hypothetical protein
MDIGASIFFTAYPIAPAELAAAPSAMRRGGRCAMTT